jgi:hypothetical protein
MDDHISEIFGNNRRLVTRRKVRLAASVSFIEGDAPAESLERPLTVLGYTRDISANGLALIVPTIRSDLSESGNYLLRIILALPTGDVSMNAIAVRHERLDASSPDIGYLVGASISEMSESDRNLYLEYLRALGMD